MTDAQEVFYMPDTVVDWPWPRIINPHFEEVKLESEAWLRSLKAFTPESQKAFDKGDFCLFSALVYPHASKEHLRSICDVMQLGFVIDEYTDVENADVTREMIDVVIDALEDPHKPRPEGEIILGEMTRQFWELAIRTATPTAQRHFIRHFTEWLESVVVQARDRDVGICRSIEDYLVVRRDNAGTLFSFSLVHLGMDFSDDIFYHPVIVELSRYATNMVIVDNDMASYNREQATGDENHNLITAIRRELDLDVTNAMRWAANYHAEFRDKFIDGLKRVPSWGPTLDRDMQYYLNGIAHWVRGNTCWNFEGRRYFGDRGLEFQKTRMVPLLKKIKINPELHREEIVVADIEV
ncbi:terpenoid synthase [Leucogyrophana mollusca]|uniref:Terpenoid synthase n=1 Tax=Leucogyrophana mollusca TaxID=85980 RepID=A0ACB8BUC9_9AGAM|nr:terpenoid synthase [Leucogyrophana mollusca]